MSQENMQNGNKDQEGKGGRVDDYKGLCVVFGDASSRLDQEKPIRGKENKGQGA